MKKLFLLCFSFLFFWGCSFFDNNNMKMEKTAPQLAEEGSNAFFAQRYKSSIKAFTDLKDWYPFSKYAILAELKIADAHFELKEYDEAIFAYENFELMHPANEAVPYVIYKMGLCWFNQLDSKDKSVAPAKNSLALFQRLIEQFPKSEYTKKAKEKILIANATLAANELYIANFYMRTKKYKAALARYNNIIKTYPGSPESRQANIKISLCLQLLKNE